MKFNQYFQNLGFTENDANIFLTLYKLGTKPASTIANNLNMERTTVYKTLLRLAKENIVSETTIGGVKHFFIPDISILKKYTDQKVLKYQKLENEYTNIETELKHFDNFRNTSIPKITIFDGQDGIKNIHNDILNNILTNKYISIKLFATNTFETQVDITSAIKNQNSEFYSNLKNNKISVDTYLADGILTMEQISKTTNIDNLINLPASNSAINIYVVGKVVYIIIFKENSFGIKLDSEELAYAMHFIFEKLKIEN